MIANIWNFGSVRIAGAMVVAGTLAIAGCGQDDAQTSAAATSQPAETVSATADGYPTEICVVSNDKLGSMGDPVVVSHEGVDVKLCCKGCVTQFEKDPAKYVAMVQAAAAEDHDDHADHDEHAGHDHN